MRIDAVAIEGDRNAQAPFEGPRGDLHLVETLHVGRLRGEAHTADAQLIPVDS